MSGPTDQLRLSDAERETASQALGEHFALGRLDADEHAERHERIRGARTHGEIPSIFEDLPGGSPLYAAAPPTSLPGAPRRTPSAAPRGVATASLRQRRRGGLPFPLKVLLAVAVAVVVLTHWPMVLIGLGVWWLLSHRGSGRCAPGRSRHYSPG